VLQAIFDGFRYGFDIMGVSGLADGTVYPALRRLEAAGYLDSQWEDEEQNFHQPDEVLHLEDLIRDERSVTPEELLVREETQEKLHNSVAQLPSSIRESFVLFCLEGFNSDEVAMIAGKDPGEVLRDVEQARQELHQKMD
jgi:DNA-directed RNA polymerase specialized sigma24 family protein